MKAEIKRILHSILRSKTELINKAITNSEIVSFDVFDTLIKRDVQTPSIVYSIMENLLLKESCSVGINFAKRRIEAEKIARIKFSKLEVTLKDIYSCMSLDYKNIEYLMRLECQTELDVSTPYIPMKQIYEKCVRQGKTIIFISDMYLPSDVILCILRKNGYTTGNLYVSSESGFTKRSKELFTHIQKQLGLDTNKWIHIGDAIHSDYLMPKKLGIRSFLVDSGPMHNIIVDRNLKRFDTDYQTLLQFINNRIDMYSDYYERLGYTVLGPLLYGFTKWLDDQVTNEETIIFLAREGALLKDAFEIVSGKPSVYLHISRHAALCAALSQIDDYSLVSQDRMRTMKRVHNNQELALNYGLSEQEIRILFKSTRIDEKQIITSSDMEKVVLKTIWPMARDKSKTQHKLLQQYLEQLHISSKCTLVDVGWNGTVQALLTQSKFSSGDLLVRWNGCYMGFFNKKESIYKNNNKIGFLFGESPNSEEVTTQQIIRFTSSFFEMMFLQTEGSTVGYIKADDGIVHPVLGKADNDQLSIVSYIRLIQKAGLQFVLDMNSSILRDKIFNKSHLAVANYLAYVRRISTSDILRFRGFRERDGDANTSASLVNEHGFFYYILHPRKFVMEFSRNTNKLLFLKGVLKLPLPYIGILTYLQKHYRTY